MFSNLELIARHAHHFTDMINRLSVLPMKDLRNQERLLSIALVTNFQSTEQQCQQMPDSHSVILFAVWCSLYMNSKQYLDRYAEPVHPPSKSANCWFCGTSADLWEPKPVVCLQCNQENVRRTQCRTCMLFVRALYYYQKKHDQPEFDLKMSSVGPECCIHCESFLTKIKDPPPQEPVVRHSLSSVAQQQQQPAMV
jgi:hypothetical protein